MHRDNGYAPDTEEYYGSGGYIQNVKRICAGGMTSFVIIQADPEDTGTLFGCGLGRKNRLWSEELEGYYVQYFHEIGMYSYDAPCFAAGYTRLMIQEQKSGYMYAAVGDDNMFQIKNDGTLWGYGSNDYGQAGYDNVPDQWTMIPGLHDMICVASGACLLYTSPSPRD